MGLRLDTEIGGSLGEARSIWLDDCQVEGPPTKFSKSHPAEPNSSNHHILPSHEIPEVGIQTPSAVPSVQRLNSSAIFEERLEEPGTKLASLHILHPEIAAGSCG